MTTTSSTSQKRTEPVTFEIQSVDEVENKEKHLLYGRSSTGKTTLFATYPGPRLLIDINDRGTASIRGTKTDMIQVKDWATLQAVYWDIVENPGRYEKYKVIGLDTITQMQSFCIERVLKKYNKDVSRAGDWGSMSKKLWGEVGQMMKTELVNWRNLDKMVVFIAQDRISKEGDEDEDSDLDIMPEIGPSLSPAVAKTIAAAVDVIGNTFIRRHIKKVGKVEKEEIQYCLRIGPHPICLTKVRKPKEIEIPSIIVDPSYEEIVAVLKGE